MQVRKFKREPPDNSERRHRSRRRGTSGAQPAKERMRALCLARHAKARCVRRTQQSRTCGCGETNPACRGPVGVMQAVRCIINSGPSRRFQSTPTAGRMPRASFRMPSPLPSRKCYQQQLAPRCLAGVRMDMARCQRCGSRSVVMRYCQRCSTLDPFPRTRWMFYIAIGLTCAAAALVAVIASR